ncbi:hypothetical protein AVEN_228008-1 [Araneus ventricosus]|uniref:Uncharacterized protein n=1 Tax=Araneus ventricosus TaxID=182803 RepID=A0A4Y2NFZ7_ARAVE|nr:hypothetical protein AVEN_228008-1 [Araneus ventricosus]
MRQNALVMGVKEFLVGRGGLLVRSRFRGRKVPGSTPDSTENSLRIWCCCTLNLTWWIKSPPVCVEQNLEDWGRQLRCRPRHLTKVEDRSNP